MNNIKISGDRVFLRVTFLRRFDRLLRRLLFLPDGIVEISKSDNFVVLAQGFVSLSHEDTIVKVQAFFFCMQNEKWMLRPG